MAYEVVWALQNGAALPPQADKGQLLTGLARGAIARALGEAAPSLPAPDWPLPDWLGRPGAVFVTLTQDGRLRGCIGSLEARRPLLDDILENARAAALADPRFPPLPRAELAVTRVEVSILSAAEPLAFHDEADAARQLRPGSDGVILEYGLHRATFLPQVWEQLPTARAFLDQLKHKAGLAPGFWSERVRLYRYTVEKYKEAAP